MEALNDVNITSGILPKDCNLGCVLSRRPARRYGLSVFLALIPCESTVAVTRGEGIVECGNITLLVDFPL